MFIYFDPFIDVTEDGKYILRYGRKSNRKYKILKASQK